MKIRKHVETKSSFVSLIKTTAFCVLIIRIFFCDFVAVISSVFISYHNVVVISRDLKLACL